MVVKAFYSKPSKCKVRGSFKSVEFIFWAWWRSVHNFMANHQIIFQIFSQNWSSALTIIPSTMLPALQKKEGHKLQFKCVHTGLKNKRYEVYQSLHHNLKGTISFSFKSVRNDHQAWIRKPTETYWHELSDVGRRLTMQRSKKLLEKLYSEFDWGLV